jgi:tRNA threonylcarbamoyladenosine biosynthesis protein TsaB
VAVTILGIETSSPVFSAAVSSGPELRAFLQVEGVGRPSGLLTDLITHALEKAGLTIEQINAIAVSIGPGSFTGLRVGIVTAKTLGWALKIPMIPVSSLEVAAQNLAGAKKEVHLLVDARKGNFYYARFGPGPDGLTRLEPDQRLKPEEAVAKVGAGSFIMGDAIDKYAELIRSIGMNPCEPVPPFAWVPRADHLCRIAQRRWPEGQVTDWHRLQPNYLYSQENDIASK